MNISSILQGIILTLCCLLQASVDASDIVCTKTCSIVHPQQQFCNADAGECNQALKLLNGIECFYT